MSVHRAPFQIRLSHFVMPEDKCELPFVVGSATQHRPDAVEESHNSQDCANLIISKSAIIGVITDGCGGTHPHLRATPRSSNEVGAKLLAYFVSQDANRLAHRAGLGSPRAFVDKLSSATQSRLKSILETLSDFRAADRELFTWDYLMATVLGFVVTRKAYLIFCSGDGIIAVNGAVQLLDAEEGIYPASTLIGPARQRRSKKSHSRFALKLFASGDIEALQSIFIATDGIYEVARKHPENLRSFIENVPDVRRTRNGFDFLLQEFRRALAWNPQLQLQWDDDATFVLLRRVGGE